MKHICFFATFSETHISVRIHFHLRAEGKCRGIWDVSDTDTSGNYSEQGCLQPVTVNHHQPFHVFLTQTILLDTTQILNRSPPNTEVTVKACSFHIREMKCLKYLKESLKINSYVFLFTDLTGHYIHKKRMPAMGTALYANDANKIRCKNGSKGKLVP